MSKIYVVLHTDIHLSPHSTMCVSIPLPEKNGTLFWSGNLHPTIFYTSRMCAGSGRISNRMYRVWQWACRGKYDCLTILTLVVSMSRRKYVLQESSPFPCQRGGNQSHSNYDVQKTRENSKMKTHHLTLEQRGGGMDKSCLSYRRKQEQGGKKWKGAGVVRDKELNPGMSNPHRH